MNEQQQQGIFKEAMEKSLFKVENEKTRFDKLMGRSEMLRLKEIFAKPVLTIENINEIQTSIIGSEIKLTDFKGNERYINHKFYLWISWIASRYSKAIRADQQYSEQFDVRRKEIELMEDLESKRIKLKSLNNVILVRKDIQKDYAIIYKEAVNTFLYGIRSPLSEEGNLIKILATERKEISYEGNLSPVPQQHQGGQ